MKWITIAKYIHLETGEILNENIEHIRKNYYIIKRIPKYYTNEQGTGIREITILCNRKQYDQLELKFE